MNAGATVNTNQVAIRSAKASRKRVIANAEGAVSSEPAGTLEPTGSTPTRLRATFRDGRAATIFLVYLPRG